MARNLQDILDFFMAQRKHALGQYADNPYFNSQTPVEDRNPVGNINTPSPGDNNYKLLQPNVEDNSQPVSQPDSQNPGVDSNQILSQNSNIPATPVPQSSLPYSPTGNSVLTRYMMGRRGVYTTESSGGDDNINVTQYPGGNTSRFPAAYPASASVASTSPSGVTSPAASPDATQGGMNYDVLNKAISDLYATAKSSPQYNKEADVDPSQFKRRHWKDILFGMAANVARANPQSIASPSGFLGALTGGGLGGALSETNVKNPDHMTPTKLGAYGQFLYGNAQAGVDQRNASRLNDYQLASQRHDKDISNLTGVVKAGESLASAQMNNEYRRTLEQSRQDTNDIRRSAEARRQSAEADREFDRQWRRDNPNLQRAKMKIGNRTVLASFNPRNGETNAIKDSKGNYVDAPDDAIRLFELKTQYEANKAAAAAAIQPPDAQKLLEEATNEVQGMKDYSDLNENEIQNRIMSRYHAKLDAAKTQYKAQQGQAKAGVRPGRAGGQVPANNNDLRDAIRKAREKVGLK
jgi:hypothetical protein